MEPWEGAVLLVGGNEETLPVLDLPDPPEVGRDKSGVFLVKGEAFGSGFVRPAVKLPVCVGDIACAGFRLF